MSVAVKSYQQHTFQLFSLNKNENKSISIFVCLYLIFNLFTHLKYLKIKCQIGSIFWYHP